MPRATRRRLCEIPEVSDACACRWMLFYLFGHLRDFVRQRLTRSKKVRRQQTALLNVLQMQLRFEAACGRLQ